MRIIVQQGNYVTVPQDFAVCFWANTQFWPERDANNAVMTHYPAHQHFVKELGVHRGKPGFVGRIIPYWHPKTGRLVIGLFTKQNMFIPGPIGGRDFLSTVQPSEPKDIAASMVALRTFLREDPRASHVKKISIHPLLGVDKSTQEMWWSKVFKDTDLNILMRYYF